MRLSKEIKISYITLTDKDLRALYDQENPEHGLVMVREKTCNVCKNDYYRELRIRRGVCYLTTTEISIYLTIYRSPSITSDDI